MLRRWNRGSPTSARSRTATATCSTRSRTPCGTARLSARSAGRCGTCSVSTGEVRSSEGEAQLARPSRGRPEATQRGTVHRLRSQPPGPAKPAAYSATAGLPFDDQHLESKLVWMYGSPRTGSTWLLEMLCHPLRINNQPPVGFSWPESWRGRAPALPVGEFLFSAHVVPSQGKTVEIDGQLMPQTLNGLLERRKPSYAFSDEFADVWEPEARRSALG